MHQILKANEDWVPPYGTGTTLYIRPFQFGVRDVVGVGSGPEFVFGIYVTPVGPYFKGGLTPDTLWLVRMIERLNMVQGLIKWVETM